jgi:hypothetical protein
MQNMSRNPGELPLEAPESFQLMERDHDRAVERWCLYSTFYLQWYKN